MAIWQHAVVQTFGDTALFMVGLCLSQSRLSFRRVASKVGPQMPGRSLFQWVQSWRGPLLPPHLRHGQLGERSAKRHLKRLGLKFLTANFRTDRGEVDLVFRDQDCLVFVEVKTRSSEEWTRPAAAVDALRRKRLSRVALDYLRLLRNPQVKVRFDIVEVLLEAGTVREVRHLPNSFPMEQPHRYW